MSEIIDAVENNDIDLVRELLDNGADPNTQNSSSETALMRAIKSEHIDIVRLLLENYADPNIRDHYGYTALMRASTIRPSFSTSGYTEITKLLLNHGADPNIRDGISGFTALMNAVEWGHLEVGTEVVELLLNRGANPFIRNFFGQTALSLAERSGYTEIVELLRRHMRSTRIQSIIRGRQTRRKIRTQKAKQRSSFMKGPYDDDSIISTNMRFDENIYEDILKNLNQMPYNPEVERRRREEEERDMDHLDWLQSFSQMGGYRRRSYRYY